MLYKSLIEHPISFHISKQGKLSDRSLRMSCGGIVLTDKYHLFTLEHIPSQGLSLQQKRFYFTEDPDFASSSHVPYPHLPITNSKGF
jgi:hypothetical protein